MADMRNDPRVEELVSLILQRVDASVDPLTMWSVVSQRVNAVFFGRATR